MVQLSHPYMTTGKTTALTVWTFVGKSMSLLFNILGSKTETRENIPWNSKIYEIINTVVSICLSSLLITALGRKKARWYNKKCLLKSWNISEWLPWILKIMWKLYFYLFYLKTLKTHVLALYLKFYFFFTSHLLGPGSTGQVTSESPTPWYCDDFSQWVEGVFSQTTSPVQPE